MLAVVSTIGLGVSGAALGRSSSAPAAGGMVGRPLPSTPAPAAARVPSTPWLASLGDGRWVFGRGDRPPIRRLPAGEAGLAIDPHLVATIVRGDGGASTVRFRETISGRLVRDVPTSFWISAGAFTPTGLVVTGYRDARMTADGGIVRIVPETGETAVLVAPGPFAADLGRPVARGEVLVSPSGRTVASNACGMERCALQVVDLASGAVSRPIDGGVGFLRAVTDTEVVTTDDAGAWIRGLALDDGHELWRRDDASLIEPVALGDGSVAGLVGSGQDGWAIAAIDGSGRVRDLTPRRRGAAAAPPLPWRALTTPAALVVGPVPFEDALASRGETAITILTPSDHGAATTRIHLPVETEAVR